MLSNRRKGGIVLKPFEKLPSPFQNDEVRPYYELLQKKTAAIVFKRIFDIFVALIMLGFLLLTDWFVLSRTDWALLVIAIVLVLSSELINTAIEKAVDLATQERHPLAKIAKDAAAGAVLVFAIGAVIVGVLIMYQPEAFRQLWAYFTTHPLGLAAFILSLIPATLFMFRGFGKKSRGED